MVEDIVVNKDSETSLQTAEKRSSVLLSSSLVTVPICFAGLLTGNPLIAGGISAASAFAGWVMCEASDRHNLKSNTSYRSALKAAFNKKAKEAIVAGVIAGVFIGGFSYIAQGKPSMKEDSFISLPRLVPFISR